MMYFASNSRVRSLCWPESLALLAMMDCQAPSNRTHRAGAPRAITLLKERFDGMGFPLILAGGVRALFADVVSTPLSERLASLMRSLNADGDERSGEANHEASAAETSSRVDRRGRRRTPQPDGGAVRRRTSGYHRVRKRRSSAGDPADRRA